jgi:hypothetical protein
MAQPFNFGIDYDGNPIEDISSNVLTTDSDGLAHPMMSASTTTLIAERPNGQGVSLTLGTTTGIEPVREDFYVRRTVTKNHKKYQMSKHRFE